MSRPLATSERRKWIVVAAATLGMMAAFGASTTISVLVKPFESEFGWPRADIAFAYTLLSAGAALGGIVSGRTIDRLDPRPIVVLGAIAVAAGLMVLSWQNDLATIQKVYLAIGVFGFACIYTPLIATVGLWFERGRGLAMGLVTAGGTLGQGVTPFILQPLIAEFGWRDACLMLGIGFFAVVVPAMMLVTKPPAAAESARGTPSQAGAKWKLPPAASVAWLGTAAAFCCASMAVPLVHLVALLADTGRTPALTGSLILTVMLAGSAGRIGFGLIADRLGALRSYALAVLGQTLTVYWFVELESLSALYALGVLFGFCFGGVMTTFILCVREAVPARNAGLSTAIVGLLAWAGMGIGGYQGGYCYDVTGSYVTSFATAALAGVANLLVLAGLALHLRWHARLAAAARLLARRMARRRSTLVRHPGQAFVAARG